MPFADNSPLPAECVYCGMGCTPKSVEVILTSHLVGPTAMTGRAVVCHECFPKLREEFLALMCRFDPSPTIRV